MVLMSAAEKFLQGLRDDRRDRAPGRAGVLPGRRREPARPADGEHRALLRGRHPAARSAPGDVAAGPPPRGAPPPRPPPRRRPARGPPPAWGPPPPGAGPRGDRLHGPPPAPWRSPAPLQPPVTQRRLEAEVAFCVGGVLSPLIFSIAMTAPDERMMAPWEDGGAMSAGSRRETRRRKGLPNYRLARYADDFAILVHGTREDAGALREEVTGVPATLGLRLSEAKTHVLHLSEGFPFLGLRIQWRRKRGTSNHNAFTFTH